MNVWPYDRVAQDTHIMTFAFNALYVSVWSTAVLAAPGAIVLFVFAGLAFAAGEAVLGSIYVGTGLFSVFWTWFIRQHTNRVLLRSGTWPHLCRGDDHVAKVLNSPEETVKVIKEKVYEMVLKYGRPPRIVGGGWGYFLQRAGPSGPRLFTHNLVGKVEGMSNTWYAGTTIAAVQKDVKPLTLSAHPTMDYISIAAWFTMGNHGNQGDAGLGNKDTFDSCLVLNMQSQQTYTLKGYEALRSTFDGASVGKFFVVHVTFLLQAFVTNKWVQKRGFVVDNPTVAAQWLAPNADLRVVFMGASRAHAIGLRWDKCYDKSTHIDPHFCSRFCQYFQTDVASVLCGCHESMTMFSGKSTLKNANRWMPYVFGWMTIAAILSRYTNYEIIFRMPALSGTVLHRIIMEMTAMHLVHGGRSELRYSAFQDYHLVYLDMAMFPEAFGMPFAILKTQFGVEEVSIHPGKFTRVNTHPCRFVTLSDLYGYKVSIDMEAAGVQKV